MNSLAPATNSSPASARNDSPGPPCWHQDFLVMLPKIEKHARFAFRHLKPDHLEEAVQEVICNCCLAFASLVEQGRAKAATWSSLAKYAVAQVRGGRRVGSSLYIKDVSSPYCQHRKGVHVGSLHHWDNQDQSWREMLVERSANRK
jgi:hypothetical protein